MTRSSPYLWQNRYGYNFRIHIPPDLQAYWGKKELKRKLDSYRKNHIERLADAYKAVCDGAVVQDAAEPVDEGQLPASNH